MFFLCGEFDLRRFLIVCCDFGSGGEMKMMWEFVYMIVINFNKVCCVCL